MKTKIRMLALSLLIAFVFIGAIFVPAVSADENNLNDIDSSKSDCVGINVELERSPCHFDDEGNRLSDREISQMIKKMPAVTYLDGMDEVKSKKISKILNQMHQYRSIGKSINLDSSSRSTTSQMDSGIRIDEYHYNGITGYNHPGNLEVSSSGTACQYFTSHIGKKINGIDTWIEVGVAKLSPAFGGNSSEYSVYTYDSTLPGDEKYVTHQTFSSGSNDYSFEIYISSSKKPEGYPYMMFWEGKVIRTGYSPFCYGDIDENHEYFALNGNSFTPVSESYFCGSYLCTSYNSITQWWNDNLPDTTKKHLSSECPAGTPELEYSVPYGSEAYQVKSWMH